MVAQVARYRLIVVPSYCLVGGGGHGRRKGGEFVGVIVGVRGQTYYNRLLVVVLSSFHAALKTNRVRLAVTPRPTVEVTSRGSIKVDFITGLFMDATKFPKDARTNGGFGVPLKLEFIPEYIVHHRSSESRINGILTPGDVFLRWVKSLIATNSDKDEGVGGIKSVPSALESLMDVISWARSMQNRK